MKRKSLKFRLVAFILVIIISMASLNIYSLFVIRDIKARYSNMIDKMIYINQIGQNIGLSVYYFDKYFTSRTINDLDLFRGYCNNAKRDTFILETYFEDNNLVTLKNLQNVIDSYKDLADKTTSNYLFSEKAEEYSADFHETKQIASYCSEYVQKLQESYLKYNNTMYMNLNKQIERNNILIMVFFVTTTVGCIVIALLFSREIIRPIGNLAEKSQRISKGELDIDKTKDSGMYEIDLLSQGFDTMVENIKELIEKIKENADIEKKLKDEEMRSLLFENMLKESQLKMLQSQINPHFLFNTLNTIAQISIIEGASETEKLINSVSDLLRYSLVMIDKQSTVKKEIEIIKQYIFIQETRFEDRVKFILEVDKLLLDVEIPGMTLQPLVENAFMHGIESKEEGGQITIKVCEEDNNCNIIIEDDGVGMPKEKIAEILGEDKIEQKEKHTSIGLKNVIKRLRIIYSNADVFLIESIENMGTKIYIKIPINKGELHV